MLVQPFAKAYSLGQSADLTRPLAEQSILARDSFASRYTDGITNLTNHCRSPDLPHNLELTHDYSPGQAWVIRRDGD